MDLNIKKGNNRFFIGENEENDIARITYFYEQKKVIVIDHTYVDVELRGKAIAGKLLSSVIEFAKANDLKIIPQCSYAVVKMTRNDEYADILYKD